MVNGCWGVLRRPRLLRRWVSSCAPTPYWPCSTVTEPGSVAQRSSSSRTTPTRSPTVNHDRLGADVDLPRDPRPAATTRQGLFGQGPQRGRHRRPRRVEPGRTTRLANRAQRRRARPVRDLCDPGVLRPLLAHQVAPRHLVGTRRADRPGQSAAVCENHHQNIHHDGWLLALGPNRELTITLPDGQVMTTGPPKRNAA